jgi:hypothetical protein
MNKLLNKSYLLFLLLIAPLNASAEILDIERAADFEETGDYIVTTSSCGSSYTQGTCPVQVWRCDPESGWCSLIQGSHGQHGVGEHKD